MRRPVLSALLLGGALLLLPAVSVPADDPGAGITVAPTGFTAGQTVLLAGIGLEPGDERVLVLQGETLAVVAAAIRGALGVVLIVRAERFRGPTAA
jgi:hypothetical protein